MNIELQVGVSRDEERIVLLTTSSTGSVLRQEGDIVLGGTTAAVSSGDHSRSADVCLPHQVVFNYVDLERGESTLETLLSSSGHSLSPLFRSVLDLDLTSLSSTVILRFADLLI